MNYGALISETFWLALRNRFLWVFGFFLGGGQIFNLLQNANNLSRRETLSFLGDDVVSFVSEVRQFVLDNLALVLGFALALVLVGIFLALIAEGALIDGVAALHRGEERSFSSAFRVGLSNFWRVLGFSALFILIAFVVGIVVVLTMLVTLLTLSATNSPRAGTALFVLVVLLLVGLFILVFVPLGIIMQLGLRALVVGRGGVFGSFGDGYDLLRRRLGRVLLVWVIGLALSLGATVALLIAALLLGLLLAVPALILFAAELSTAGTVAGLVAAVILLIALVVALAAIATFNHAYWTLAYLRLTAEEDAGVERQVLG